MPELAGVDFEQRIAELVDRHRAELEQLIDAELDRALDVIVSERIEARNGTTSRDEYVSASPVPVELCSLCGEKPPVVGRTICNRCRGRRRRERRAQAAHVDADGPRPAADAQRG